jgi:hypothetical protein
MVRAINYNPDVDFSSFAEGNTGYGDPYSTRKVTTGKDGEVQKIQTIYTPSGILFPHCRIRTPLSEGFRRTVRSNYPTEVL